MITHELAKKLKDAGFPQHGDGKIVISPNTDMTSPTTMVVTQDECYAPTLSELIEACGEHLVEIKRIVNSHGITWRANGNANPKNYPDWGYSMACLTPEKAVAMLWIELNKK